MMRHLFKLVWNRKRANALVILEIFAAFMVLFVTLTVALYFVGNFNKPLGYEWNNVWRVSIDVGQASDDEWSEETVNRFRNLLVEVKNMPEVANVAGIQYPPYLQGNSVWGGGAGHPDIYSNEVTDEVFDVLQMDVVAGRPFQASDDAFAWTPVVIDRDLARAVFGNQSPLGQRIDPMWGEKVEGIPDLPDFRVVGVISDFRKDGELEPEHNMMLIRTKVGDVKSRPPRNLVLRLEPGSSNFEQELVRRLQRTAPDWSFSVQPLSRTRDLALRLQLAPLMIGVLIAAFLVLMVGLGLTGILWQNVTRRTAEIGLRRAVGASARGIHSQILLEVFIVVSIGIALGVLLVIQIPILGWMKFLGPSTIPFGIVASALSIYGITTLCALYPSMLAARVQPAEALHYE